MTRIAALLVAVAVSWPAAALDLTGSPAQGALLIGRVAPGEAARLDGRDLRIGPDGRFVFGFGRDQGPDSLLAWTESGAWQEKRLAVAQRTWKIQRIDRLDPDKVTPPPGLAERIARENALIAATRKTDSAEPWYGQGWIWPAEGPVSGVYGSQRILNGQPKQPHYGLDIAAPEGAPVVAAAPGRVLLAEPDFYLTGGTLVLDHGHGVTSIFIHLKSIDAKVGDIAARGQRVGSVGKTGRATGPHLHWGLAWFDVRLDPQLVLPARP